MGSRSNKEGRWPKPESGGKPKRIVADGPAGGPHTPGAKEEARKKAESEKNK